MSVATRRRVLRPGRYAISAPAPRRGASLIELLIASVLMTVAVLGLLGTSREIAEQVGGSRLQMVAASVAQARLDSLQSLPCSALTSLATGSQVTRGIRESWTIGDGTYAREVVLTLRIPRLRNPVVYTTLVPCA